MSLSAMTDPILAAHVRVGLTRQRARERLLDAAQRLDEEQGAQAAEYAMLGGVSAAACGALVAIIRDRSTLETVVSAVVTSLARAVRSWF